MFKFYIQIIHNIYKYIFVINKLDTFYLLQKRPPYKSNKLYSCFILSIKYMAVLYTFVCTYNITFRKNIYWLIFRATLYTKWFIYYYKCISFDFFSFRIIECSQMYEYESPCYIYFIYTHFIRRFEYNFV